MIDVSIIIILATTAIAIIVFSYVFTRAMFIRKQKVLEEQVRGKSEIIEGLEKTLHRTQVEKEQFLTRAIKAETQLVMVKVAMAESRENGKEMMEDITIEDVELARQILEIDSQIILSKI
ncbi:MAG: hypothetical protein WCJ80_02790 [Bacteroidota bacterium]|jgi:hypothetical protein